jgi:hypothetical protein
MPPTRLAILLTALGIPLVLTWLRFLPFMSSAEERVKTWLYPSIIGTCHDRPLPFLIGNAPTIGQRFYIAVVFILNIVFLAVGYKTLYPDRIEQWYTSRYQELMAYFMWRTGVLAFCQMPILFLFATRNNILLWLTNWSYSTYMLLHRWTARFFLLQTLLHSIIALVLYVNTGSYATSLQTLWWIWGCVATVAAVIIFLTSILFLRRRAYELFLVTHIAMAVICVVGCWYHVWYGYENTFGYETWLYATIAVWFFDRLARLGRIMKAGVRRAKVTDVGPSIVRVDILGIRWSGPGRCAYVYFPTLNPFRPWENHPFSLTAAALLNGHHYSDQATGSQSDTVEKNHSVRAGSKAVIDGKGCTNSGVTLFVRKKAGLTGYFKAQEGLLTLIEGPYPTHSTRNVLKSDRLLLIGGGMGITGLLPFLSCHPNVKLFHGVKADDKCLLDALSPVLDQVREKELRIGHRLELSKLLHDEAGLGWSKIAVVVCGVHV